MAKRHDKLHEYQVTLPIMGVAYVTVQAHSEREAIELAMQEDIEIDSWNVYDCIHKGGGVWYAEEPAEAEADDQGEVQED